MTCYKKNAITQTNQPTNPPNQPNPPTNINQPDNPGQSWTIHVFAHGLLQMCPELVWSRVLPRVFRQLQPGEFQ